ncbi:hypothetical protein JRQ81_016811, partial [Phrynocephalus forsythii]
MAGQSQGAQGRDAKGEGSRYGRERCCPGRPVPSQPLLAAFLLSVLSVASCVYLGVKMSDLQGRVFLLEAVQGDLSSSSSSSAAAVAYSPLPGSSLDQLNSLVQEKVERLLAQKSYEHMAKIRIAREAPPECNCPP